MLTGGMEKMVQRFAFLLKVNGHDVTYIKKPSNFHNRT